MTKEDKILARLKLAKLQSILSSVKGEIINEIRLFSYGGEKVDKVFNFTIGSDIFRINKDEEIELRKSLDPPFIYNTFRTSPHNHGTLELIKRINTIKTTLYEILCDVNEYIKLKGEIDPKARHEDIILKFSE